MSNYFAFGSNMSRARLESRIGSVIVWGPARLSDYRHKFSHLGADGTGKGNIEREAEAQVHGVLYRLDPEQLERLDAIEHGYRRTEVEVWTLCIAVKSWTYVAPQERGVAPPSAKYLEHYRRGLEEHELPTGYARWVLSSSPPISSSS